MDSIVLQLQREAMDRAVPVSDLLRKALVVARKLKLIEFQEWISNELGGYAPGSTIAEYRRLQGQVRAENPYHGWIPVAFESPKDEKKFSERQCNQSIPELESIVGDDDALLLMPFADDVARRVTGRHGPPLPLALHVQQSAIVGVLNRVRDTILNWALQLEEDGILGHGLSFSSEERAAAESHTYNITNFYGDVRHPQIAQGSPNAVQTATVAGRDLEDVRRFISMLREQRSGLALDAERGAELQAELATLESQSKSPKPKETIVRESLLSIRRILESAAGSSTGILLRELGSLLM